MPVDDKICARCGRRIAWRRKWATAWDQVRYCSHACRRRRLGATDRALEDALARLLATRGRGASLCPSEAARAVRPDDWRDWMEAARQAARRLHARGVVVITQGGHAVDPSTARGPIRVRLAEGFTCAS